MTGLTFSNGAEVRTRHPLAPLGLSVITFGIYLLVWYFKINREMRDLGERVVPGLSLLAITLGAVLIIPPFVSVYNTAERVRRVQEHAGIANPISPILAVAFVLIPFIGFLQTAYMQSHLNRAYEAAMRSGAARPTAEVARVSGRQAATAAMTPHARERAGVDEPRVTPERDDEPRPSTASNP